MSKRQKELPGKASPLAKEAMSNGWRIVLPRVGVTRAGHGLFWVGVCFCLGLAVITAAFLVLPHVGSTEGGVYTPPDHVPVPAPALVVLGVFWLAGVGTLLAGVRMGLRRGVIEVVPDVLRIQQIDPFSSRSVELPRTRIVAVQHGPTGISLGGTRGTGRSGARGMGVDELHVYTDDGGRLRFFAGRTTSELEALAAELREILAVGTKRYDGT